VTSQEVHRHEHLKDKKEAVALKKATQFFIKY